MPTPHRTPAPRPAPSGMVEKPITPVMPGSPVPAARTSRARWLSLAGSLVLAGLVALGLLVWPRGDQPAAGPTPGDSAEGAIGAAPGAGGATGSAPSGGSTSPAAAAGTDTGASAAPGLTTGPTAGAGALVVSSQITSGVLGSSVVITIANTGGSTAVWHSVMLQLSEGVNLGVSSSDASVAYSRQGGAHCFVPANGTLTSGQSVTFTASVAGLLNSIRGTPLDTAPCPA